MDNVIDKKLIENLGIIKEILAKAKLAPENLNIMDSTKKEFMEIIEEHIDNAENFLKNDDFIKSFTSLSYAQGWLDAGAKVGIFDLSDLKLFKKVDLVKNGK